MIGIINQPWTGAVERTRGFVGVTYGARGGALPVAAFGPLARGARMAVRPTATPRSAFRVLWTDDRKFRL